jgi:GT2 family glycosyltransferase
LAEISVIIVNWNGKHFLEDCLSSLQRQTFRDFETILVDNGSSDGSCAYVREHFPEVRLVALGENRGFTGGNIAGYAQATGELIVLLNNDTEAHPEWLAEIHDASGRFPNAGSFASKMMYFDVRDRIENCGFALAPTGTTIDIGRDEPDGPEWQESSEVFGACGGAVTYRRSMLNDIGFLDPDFFMVYEDVDLSFRAQLRGYTCVYIPRAVVFHRYRASLGKLPAHLVYYSQRNVEFVYLKNLPAGLMVRCALHRFLYEIGAAIYFTRKGHGAAFLRSKLNVIKNFPTILRKRQEVQQSKVVSNSKLQAMMKPILVSKWTKLRSTWK